MKRRRRFFPRTKYDTNSTGSVSWELNRYDSYSARTQEITGQRVEFELWISNGNKSLWLTGEQGDTDNGLKQLRFLIDELSLLQESYEAELEKVAVKNEG